MIQSDTEVSCERFPRRGGERDTPTLATRYALLSAGCWIWQQILLDIDMWEDGTDHVLYPWCFHVWWDVADPPCPTAWHSEGYVHKGWTLFFWLGRCQHTFIWSARDGGFSLNQTDGKMWLEALCAYKFKGNLKQIIWVTQMEKKKNKQLVMNRENVRVEIGTHCSWEELHLSQVLVTTQMICRYYWNLGIEQQTRDQMKDADAKTDKAEAGRRK